MSRRVDFEMPALPVAPLAMLVHHSAGQAITPGVRFHADYTSLKLQRHSTCSVRSVVRPAPAMGRRSRRTCAPGRRRLHSNDSAAASLAHECSAACMTATTHGIVSSHASSVQEA